MKAIWNLGFRPFFLFGAAWGAMQIGVWAIFQAGWLPTIPYRDPIVWHAHEMIFGFATAIVAGFILTASQNWAGTPGILGAKLIALVALWASARLLSIVWNQLPLLFAVVDLSFIPMLAISLKPYLWQQSQKRNQIFFVLFFILFITNLFIHLDGLGVSLYPARSILLTSIYIFILMIALIGGRVIPFFTSNVLPTANSIRWPLLDWMGFFSIAAIGISITCFEFTRLSAGLAFLAAMIHMIRWLLWKPWKSIRVPILFILYVGYVWIPIGLFLRGFASLGWIASSASTHAFTTGAIGIMIYGMITRVSLGHTGRKIHASSPIIFGYFLIFLSAIIRVFGPLMYPLLHLIFVEISGWLWFGAFTIYVIIYAPILCKPRLDGKPG